MRLAAIAGPLKLAGPKDFLVGVSNLSWLCLECSIQLQHRRSRWHFPEETSHFADLERLGPDIFDFIEGLR